MEEPVRCVADVISHLYSSNVDYTLCCSCGITWDLVDELELRGQCQRQVCRSSKGGGQKGQTRGPARSTGCPSYREEMALCMLRQRLCSLSFAVSCSAVEYTKVEFVWKFCGLISFWLLGVSILFRHHCRFRTSSGHRRETLRLLVRHCTGLSLIRSVMQYFRCTVWAPFYQL